MQTERLDFRAWDGQKMIYPGNKGLVIVYSSSGVPGAVDLGRPVGGNNQDYRWNFLKGGEPQLMQSIGLKDSTGKTVYEHDIVLAPHNIYANINRGTMYTVVWVTEWAQFCILDKGEYETYRIQGAYCEAIQAYGRERFDIEADWISKATVLGNLYENPLVFTQNEYDV